MPGSLLGDTRKETDTYLCPHRAYILVRKQDNKQKRSKTDYTYMLINAVERNKRGKGGQEVRGQGRLH